MDYYILVVDDSDVRHLMNVTKAVRGKPINVYVVVDEGKAANGDGDRRKTLVAKIFSGKTEQQPNMYFYHS